ncbi:MAG: TRAP transporter substrate-binding protein [Alphaproteobacteria bacterium]
MNKRIAFALLAAGFVAPLVSAQFAAAQDQALRYNRWLPPTHHIDNNVFKPWFEQVAKATSGRVKIEFTTSSLGPLPRQFELATSGVADVTFGSESLTPGRFPLAEILEVPFLGNSAEATSVAYWRVYKAHFEKAETYTGTKLLGLSGLPPYHIYNNKRPIVSLADFKGLKLRAAGKYLTDMTGALGAVSVPAQITELYDLLSKGVIDGTLYMDDGIRSFNLAKFLPHKTEIPGGLSSFSSFVVINKRKWDAISAADRAAIEAIAGENLARLLGRSFDESAAVGQTQMKEAGVKVVVADAQLTDALKKQLAFLEQRWVGEAKNKGVDGVAALKMLRDEAAKYKKP